MIFCYVSVHNVTPAICFVLIIALCTFSFIHSDIECRNGKYVWEDHRPRSGVWKGTNGGEVISFSGCDDDQTSADTSVKSWTKA